MHTFDPACDFEQPCVTDRATLQENDGLVSASLAASETFSDRWRCRSTRGRSLEQIAVVADCSAWWRGDWLVHGEKTYGDRYKQVIKGTSFAIPGIAELRLGGEGVSPVPPAGHTEIWPSRGNGGPAGQ